MIRRLAFGHEPSASSHSVSSAPFYCSSQLPFIALQTQRARAASFKEPAEEEAAPSTTSTWCQHESSNCPRCGCFCNWTNRWGFATLHEQRRSVFAVFVILIVAAIACASAGGPTSLSNNVSVLKNVYWTRLHTTRSSRLGTSVTVWANIHGVYFETGLQPGNSTCEQSCSRGKVCTWSDWCDHVHSHAGTLVSQSDIGLLFAGILAARSIQRATAAPMHRKVYV